MNPKAIEFQTNNNCNGKCIICPHTEVYTELSLMPDKNIDQIINYAKEHNVKRLIPYLNNEPFLDKRMINIIKKIKSSKIEVEISTNLSALSYKDINLIFSENIIDDFRISFFGGTKEIYNKMMPGLNYEENFKKLSYIFEKYYTSNVEVCMVLSPNIDIYKEAEFLRKQIKNIKIRFFGYLDRAGNNKEKNHLVLNKNEYNIINCSLNREKERICINSSGDCVLCSQDWRGKHIYGNINNNSLKNIWTSKSRKKNLKKISGEITMEKDFLCQKCKIAILKKNNNEVLNFMGDCYVTREGIKV